MKHRLPNFPSEDVGDAVGRPDEDLVFAPIHAGNAARLAKVVPDGNIRQGGRDADEVDGEAPRPADHGTPAVRQSRYCLY
jgi:hypothetical protein